METGNYLRSKLAGLAIGRPNPIPSQICSMRHSNVGTPKKLRSIGGHFK
jgi:hypothetical protein